MSSRQASALARVGRLRAGLVTALRRSFPDQTATAESQMGRRLADVDDEVLLVFLDSLLRTATGREERATLEALGSALALSGIIADQSAPPTSWLAAIQSARKPVEIFVDAQPVTPEKNNAANTLSEASQNFTGPDRVSVPLESLFGNEEVSEPQNSTNEIDLGWDDVTFMSDSPIDVAEPATLEDLFPQTDTPISNLVPLIDLWPDENLGDPSQSGDSWSPSPVRSDGTGATGPAAPAAVPPPTVFENVLRPELFPTAARTSKKSAASKKRSTRLQAEPATDESNTLSDEHPVPQSHEGLDDTLRQAFIAASAIPRPVFTRDLVAIAGDPAIVALWEDECRAHPDLNQVRFVSPKARHRLRGSLIIPNDNLRVAPRRGYDDWWTQAVNRYLGARLYELGVLLHRVGDELVSTRFGEHTVALRLNSNRGLVAIIIVMSDRLEAGEPARAELEAALADVFAERLTLAAVLMSAGEERDLTRLVETTVALANQRGWKPSFPVVAARSWEYADDRGSTARVILGD